MSINGPSEGKERIKPKILIVEDSDVFSSPLRKLMERWGYEVSIATNEEEALELSRTQNPDLITMDGELVKKDAAGKEIRRDLGPDIAAKIRAQNPKVIITMLSSYDLKFEGRGIQKGGSPSLIKDHLQNLLSEAK